MSLVRTLRRHATTGAFAVADQSLIAGSNFLLSALLARWLTAAEYGAFSVIYTAFQLLMTMHMAMTSEPLLVLGSTRYSGRLRPYIALLSRLQWIPGLVVSAVSLVVAVVANVRGSGLLGAAALGLAIAAPVVLSQQFMRRAFYAELKPSRSVWGGAVYLVTMLGVLFFMFESGSLSVTGGFLAMGVASLSAVALYSQWLRTPQGEQSVDTRDVLREHWRYGRWSVPTTLLTWVPGNIYYTLLPVWHGLGATADLQALMNLVLPVQHAISAVAVLLVPVYGRRLSQDGVVGLARGIRWGLMLLVGIACAYGVVIVGVGPAIADWLYGSGKYALNSGLLALASLLAIGGAMTSVLGGALRALNSPRRVFFSYGLSFLFSVTGGLFLMYQYRVWGAVASLVASSALLTSPVVVYEGPAA
ncbi:MAG: hypothetical protein QMC79_10105 [Anaerosomatales bacterium]|nr:hypothetical protein [Anaerosomatales bacterium]